MNLANHDDFPVALQALMPVGTVFQGSRYRERVCCIIPMLVDSTHDPIEHILDVRVRLHFDESIGLWAPID